MAGTNPYMKPVEHALPTQKYTVTVNWVDLPGPVKIEVDPDKLPYQRSGQPGSILDILLGQDIEIEHTCGGVCACSTCHVMIRQGLATCNEATEDEEDQLDDAPGLSITSRLACQCVPNGTQDIVVEVPAWNRNAVKEGH